MNLDLLASLKEFARSSPRRPALCTRDGVFSYADLLDQCQRLASALEAGGVRKGDRVIVALENSVEFVVAYLATLALRAIVVPWNSMSPGASLEGVVQDCTPTAALVERRHRDWLPALAEASPSLASAYVVRDVGSADADGLKIGDWSDQLASYAPSDLVRDLSPDDVAAIIYTSGTTGLPKGVMLSNRNLDAIAVAGLQMLDLRSESRVGIIAPLFHLYGLREVDAALRVGAAVLLPPGGSFITSQLTFFKSAGVTGISAVPSVLAVMVEKYPAGLSSLQGQLRYLTIGTAPATTALVQRLRELLPNTRLVLTYGLTECSRVCFRDVLERDDMSSGGNVGRPYPGVEIDLQEASEGIGRVVVRSPMVMRGYWNRPAATAAVIREDGTLITPDCGRIAPDGELHLLGRFDDVINCGGHKVSPDEVEEKLALHAGVAQVAVAPSLILQASWGRSCAPLSYAVILR